MAAQRPQRPVTRAGLVPFNLDDAATDRALSDVAASVSRLEGQLARNAVRADLVVGSNRIVHGLGRAPTGANLTPTVADASFAWAMASADERTVVITIVGVDQPGACLEVF